MFEKYTETARKVIFYARYEASQFGCEHIDTEHLLLGILREDGPLALRLFKEPEKVASIRQRIEKQFPRREKISTTVDLPLSADCKRVLTYGAEEAERLQDDYIAPEHFLLGLLREPGCVASKIMVENGLTASQVERELLPVSPARKQVAVQRRVASAIGNSRDLTAEARSGTLNALIGRERELERTIQILSRRTRNNAVLVGEPGVGKNAIVQGLAQRIADGL